MFVVGHIALGYIIGKITSKATGQSPIISAIWALSLLPDIDFLIPGLRHRGPTHSLVIVLLIFIPLLILRFRETVPYFAALATHLTIGDYITDGGVQLFWPLSSKWVNLKSSLRLGSVVETYIELALFGALILTLILSKDLNRLFNLDRRNNLLFLPLFTIVLPLRLKYPVNIPKMLIVPHILLLSLITLSCSITLMQTLISIYKGRH